MPASDNSLRTDSPSPEGAALTSGCRLDLYFVDQLMERLRSISLHLLAVSLDLFTHVRQEVAPRFKQSNSTVICP
jgi:hypothetical protein